MSGNAVAKISTVRPSSFGPRYVTPIDSSVKVPSLVNELTHPTTSLSSATWYAFRIAASLAVIGEYSFLNAYEISFTEIARLITTRAATRQATISSNTDAARPTE